MSAPAATDGGVHNLAKKAEWDDAIQKPGLVGSFRPHWKAPNVQGLYFASETFKSRGIGIDRAARAGLSCVEDILGRRLWPLEEGFRY